MTEFPPSENLEHPQAPFDPAHDGAGSRLHKREEIAPEKESSDESAADSDDPAEVLKEQIAKAVPPLITEATPPLITDAEDEEEESPFEPPYQRQELFDEEAWRRISPQGVYAYVVRPILGGVLLGFLLIPVMLTVAALALCNWVAFRDRSKIFFKQTRTGYRAQEFELWKFRTMRETSKSDYDSWRDGNEAKRVTKFGRFLRRSHLDELPQIINVLKGEMTFIGPRPEMVDVNQQIQSQLPTFYQRLAVRPGITGFAQITQGYAGNDIHAYRRKLEADLVYINDLTFQRDLGVLLVTPFWMLRLLGWQNDPASSIHDLPGGGDDFPSGVISGTIPRADDDDDDFPSGARVALPKPRPGNLSAEASRFFEELEPIPPV